MVGSADRIPDGIEPIVGYRLWVYTLGETRAGLHSLNPAVAGNRLGAERWELAGSRWVVASCWLAGFHPVHAAPAEHCTCGFYVMRSLPRLIEEADPLLHLPIRAALPWASRWPDPGIVLGRVRLAGKIIEHEHGYRAERARIAELIPIEGTEDSVTRLATELGVPVAHPIRLPPSRVVPNWTRTAVTATGPSSPGHDRERRLSIGGWGLTLCLWLILKFFSLLFSS